MNCSKQLCKSPIFWTPYSHGSGSFIPHNILQILSAYSEVIFKPSGEDKAHRTFRVADIKYWSVKIH